MNVVSHISNTYFGGTDAKFAKWLGLNPSNIWRWKTSDSIPLSAQREILSKSDADGLGITPADFFPARLARYQNVDSGVEAVA